jgi:N-acetylglucosaminyldiphosphoundecaprenol N-acetyl-beta-D-mannosaminyltransferase
VETIQRINILGVGVSALNPEMALRTIERWIQDRSPHYVCVRDVHGVVRSVQDKNLRQIHNCSGLVVPDGMPLVWVSRLKGYTAVQRVYGPDLMLNLCSRSIKSGYRHFLYGGGPGINEMLAKDLRNRFPGLQIVGMYSPPFRPLSEIEDQEICARIQEVKPDIVWVGLSTPKQEFWMSEHIDRLNVPVLIGVGAAFDFHAGVKPQAPRWMQNSGLEWLFRLASEPKRLWRRYLVNNPLFLILIAAQLLGLLSFPLEE